MFKTDGAVLETPLLDLPPRQSFVSVLRRVRRSQVDVGNVEFQIRLKNAVSDGCEFDTSFRDIAL